MTTLQIYESIQQAFPNIGQAQILLDMDTSQKKFASDTGILTAQGALASISSNAAWSLPAEFKRLLDVTFYDGDDNPVYIGEDSFKIRYEIEFDKFFIYATDSTPITGVPSAASTAFIHYEKTPTTISSTSTTLEIDVEYRDAIESDVLRKYFGKFPVPAGADQQGNPVLAINLRAAQYHGLEYDRVRIQAKRDFNAREHTESEPINYQYPGKFALPRRVRDTSQGTTATNQITALTALYAKYVAYTLVSPSTVTQTVTPVVYSTLSTSLSGDTFTLSSTTEFGNDTQIKPSNEDATYIQNSSSEIVFTLPVGWGTIAFEIWERV